jgi:hypothetical protein
VSRRISTNTPLQALVTLNDPVYVEAAVALAKKVMSNERPVEEMLREAYKTLTYRDINPQKFQVLSKLYNESLRKYKTDAAGLDKLTGVKNPSPELGAMTAVTTALLNLDEVIMKE